ncbi:acetylserotonin O-methyltransferase-like [Dendropsophus ebraccatus]|uniref:acetylserotonin O-methyltransferase-like n=1 Tax=Dendropsophus ebraccatus TaxID=150705 RepID=UPI0038310BD6
MCSLEKPGYPQKLFDYMDGFAVSKTMFTACELGVFDLLHEVQEPMSAATIASRLSTSVDGMERLLNACVGLELLKVDLKNNEGYYSNTDGSTVYLVKSSPRTLYHMMMFNNTNAYMFYHFLPQAVREGKPQYERALGTSSREIFEVVYPGGTVTEIPAGEGGCSGNLAKQFVSTYKESTVTIMDLPKVVQMAKKHFITNTEQHIHFLEGDFFEDPIPEADLYIMARVIHDWNEEKCLGLLRKIYQSCRPGGGVLIVEAVLNEDRSGPVHSQLSALKMLVQTEGKERTPSEYTKLLTDSGFRDIEVKATGKLHNAIIGRK